MCDDVTALNCATKFGLSIDHSYESGEIRCATKCNTSLFRFKGSIEYLQYLKAAHRTLGS